MEDIRLTREQTLFDNTPVENLFIEQYLPGARGDFVKVYLYLLMLANQPGQQQLKTDALARMLGIDTQTVIDALRYWDRQGAMVRRQDGSYGFCNLATEMLTPHKKRDTLEKQLEYFRQFNRSLQELFGNRILKPDEYKRAQDWTTADGCTQQMVLSACRYGIARSRSGKRVSFTYIDRVLQGWLADGLTEQEAANRAEAAGRADSGATAVLRRLGESARYPSMDEEALYTKWTRQWGFTQEAVLAACAKTTAARNPSFAYLDRILQSLQATQGRDAASIQQAVAQDTAQRQLAAQVQHALGLAGSVIPSLADACQQYLAAGFAQKALVTIATQVGLRGGKVPQWTYMADKLAAQGLTTARSVTDYFTNRHRAETGLLQACDAMGLQRPLTDQDLQTYTTWREQWQLPQEVILLAAGQSAHAKNPIAYCHRKLQSWCQEGLTTPQAVHAKLTSKPSAGGPKLLEALQYQQREYTAEELYSRFDLP